MANGVVLEGSSYIACARVLHGLQKFPFYLRSLCGAWGFLIWRHLASCGVVAVALITLLTMMCDFLFFFSHAVWSLLLPVALSPCQETTFCCENHVLPRVRSCQERGRSKSLEIFRGVGATFLPPRSNTTPSGANVSRANLWNRYKPLSSWMSVAALFISETVPHSFVPRAVCRFSFFRLFFQEQRLARVRARPLPAPTNGFCPQPSDRPLTETKEFSLSSQARHEKAEQEFRERVRQEEERARRATEVGAGLGWGSCFRVSVGGLGVAGGDWGGGGWADVGGIIFSVGVVWLVVIVNADARTCASVRG